MQCRWLVSLLLVLGTVLYTRTFASFCLLCFLQVLLPANTSIFVCFCLLCFYWCCFLQTPAFLFVSLFVSVSFVFTGAVSCKHLHFFFSLLCFYWCCFLQTPAFLFLSLLFLLVLFPAPYLHFCLFLSFVFYRYFCFQHTPATCIFVCFCLLCFLQVLFPAPHLNFICFCLLYFFTGIVSCATPAFCLFLSPLGFSSGTGVLFGAPALLHVSLSVPVHTCTFVWFFYRHWVLLGICCALHQFKWRNAHELKEVFAVLVLFQLTINC